MAKRRNPRSGAAPATAASRSSFRTATSSYNVDAGVEDEDALWAHTFDYPGKTVGWRIAGGKPFAIIYRLRSANPERPRTTVLAVESIVEMRGHPGCRVATIPGSTRNANQQARSAADRLLRTRPACLKPK